jgi:phosphoglycerol transferase MdoB-like AlkP superfamily enzyme
MIEPLRRAYQGSRALTILTAVMTALLLVAAVGLVIDDRTVGGQPVWLKPSKFAISFIVYAVTLAWLMSFLRRGRRLAMWAARVVAVTAYLEVGIIVFQASRGRASHFNEATDLDAMLWASMGAVIMVLWLATAVITGLLWREGMPDRAGTWAVRLGLVLMLAGFLQGLTMVPRMAHAVGVPDGDPGMPLTGWSTTGGDLRIGHFVGIHALQAMLLFAMVSSWLVRDAVRRARLVVVFAFSYAGLLFLVTWQALRGQPLLSPDSTTLAAFGLWAAGTAVAAGLSWLRRGRTAG